VDEALLGWRQGDCVVGEQWFVRRIDPSVRVTGVSYDTSSEDIDLQETCEKGFVVVTQTCDIVRACAERPYLEVCPLIEIPEGALREAEKGRRPALAVVPLLRSQRLVADLDRVMTVEKPVVATWPRTPGWTTDDEARDFAASLARKRARFAFPDDFVRFAKRLEDRLSEKHDKQSDEGRALRALREIRVQASPAWDATGEIALMFWFVRNDQSPDFEGRSWADLLETWRRLVPPNERFSGVEAQVATLDEMVAADYVYSDPLDLDHLSSR
jgi:hypothetical protein